MDTAPDALSLLLPAASQATGSSLGARTSHSNSKPDQSFVSVFESQVALIEASRPVLATSLGEPLLATAEADILSQSGGFASALAGPEQSLGDAPGEKIIDEQSGKALPVSGEVLPLPAQVPVQRHLQLPGTTQAPATVVADTAAHQAMPAVNLSLVPTETSHTVASGQTAIQPDIALAASIHQQGDNRPVANKTGPSTGRSVSAEQVMAMETRMEGVLASGQAVAEEQVRHREVAQASMTLQAESDSDALLGLDARRLVDTQSPRLQDQALSSGLQNLIQNTAATAAKPPALNIGANMLNDPTWTEGFSERIGWMLGKGEQSATIQLAPEELGKLQLRITMNQGGTQLEVHARNSSTADLMESMMPKLQASLESQGIRLDEVKFSQQPLTSDRDFSHAFAQGGQHPDGGRKGTATTPTLDSADTGLAELVAMQTDLAGPASVDYYA